MGGKRRPHPHAGVGKELLAGDPFILGRRRCRRLAELTGVASESIWQWGFIERTSTGLLLLKLGFDQVAQFFSILDAWRRGDSP